MGFWSKLFGGEKKEEDMDQGGMDQGGMDQGGMDQGQGGNEGGGDDRPQAPTPPGQ